MGKTFGHGTGGQPTTHGIHNREKEGLSPEGRRFIKNRLTKTRRAKEKDFVFEGMEEFFSSQDEKQFEKEGAVREY